MACCDLLYQVINKFPLHVITKSIKLISQHYHGEAGKLTQSQPFLQLWIAK